MTDNYIVLDTETTGLNPARDKVLEIGAARIEQGRVVETFETLIDTGVPIPERITELTGITDAMQAEGKKTEEAFREFFDFCKDLPILGHNITFDFSFLKQMAVNLGYSFEKDGIDTLKIARKVLADLPSRRLPDLCVHYGIDPRNSYAKTRWQYFRTLLSNRTDGSWICTSVVLVRGLEAAASTFLRQSVKVMYLQP